MIHFRLLPCPSGSPPGAFAVPSWVGFLALKIRVRLVDVFQFLLRHGLKFRAQVLNPVGMILFDPIPIMRPDGDALRLEPFPADGRWLVEAPPVDPITP